MAPTKSFCGRFAVQSVLHFDMAAAPLLYSPQNVVCSQPSSFFSNQTSTAGDYSFVAPREGAPLVHYAIVTFLKVEKYRLRRIKGEADPALTPLEARYSFQPGDTYLPTFCRGLWHVHIRFSFSS